jgi:hypothetical protein
MMCRSPREDAAVAPGQRPQLGEYLPVGAAAFTSHLNRLLVDRAQVTPESGASLAVGE